MTSLHLQRFIVQMSLASLSGFGQCCLFSKPEILPPAPSLIRPLQDIHTAQLLFLRRTLPPLLTRKTAPPCWPSGWADAEFDLPIGSPRAGMGSWSQGFTEGGANVPGDQEPPGPGEGWGPETWPGGRCMDENYWPLPLSDFTAPGRPWAAAEHPVIAHDHAQHCLQHATLGTPSAWRGLRSLTLSHLHPRPRKVRSQGWLVAELCVIRPGISFFTSSPQTKAKTIGISAHLLFSSHGVSGWTCVTLFSPHQNPGSSFTIFQRREWRHREVK